MHCLHEAVYARASEMQNMELWLYSKPAPPSNESYDLCATAPWRWPASWWRAFHNKITEKVCRGAERGRYAAGTVKIGRLKQRKIGRGRISHEGFWNKDGWGDQRREWEVLHAAKNSVPFHWGDPEKTVQTCWPRGADSDRLWDSWCEEKVDWKISKSSRTYRYIGL